MRTKGDGRDDDGAMSISQLVVRHEVVVGLEPDRAFALFTGQVGAWWPMNTLSVHGSAGRVAFEGDAANPGAPPSRLVEHHPDRPREVWAEVIDWAPPRRLRLSWHPGTPADEATDLLFVFGAEGSMTRIALEQTGWEGGPDPEDAVAMYEERWPQVLGRFVEAATPAGPEARTER
jgi:hypothetical protein